MKLYLKYFLQVIIAASLLSCTSDVDFNQVKNIELNQRIASPFIYIDADQNKFLNTNATSEISTFSFESNFDIFSSDYFKENLVKTNFTFEIENSFNRSFNIVFSFLNANNAIAYSFSINVPQNNNFSHIQIVEGLDLLSLKLTEKLKITIELQPSSDSSIIDKNVKMNLVIKSFTNFNFIVN